MQPQIVSLNSVSLSFNEDNAKGVYRESIVGSIETLIEEGANIIMVEGDTGIGKTRVMSQIADKYKFDCVSYFANKLNKITFNQNFIIQELARQIYFVLTNNQPDDRTDFDQSSLNAMHLDLIKNLRKRRRKLLFVLDGLDQIPVSELEQLKQVLDILPWDNSNTCIIISGDTKITRVIKPELIDKKSVSVRVLQFGFEETCKFFATTIEDDEYLKEVHKTWKGHPERLSDIKRILSKGITIEQFIKEDITEKNKLLDIEWQKVENSINDEWQYMVLATICYDVNLNSISKISTILSIDYELINRWIKYVSFIIVKDEYVTYTSASFKDFASKKLNKFENEVSQKLINYYLNSTDDNSIVNLTSYYEKTESYGQVVKLLNLDNLSKIIYRSKSFTEINTLIRSGYKAANKLTLSYDNVFKFALHKSIFMELQVSDLREAEIQACVALSDNDKALEIISRAVLLEDKFKMLVVYARECKLKKVNIDKAIIDEIKKTFEEVDYDYLKENIVEIAISLVQVQPSLALRLIERASDKSKDNHSLEWLLSYLSVFANKNISKDDQAVQDMSSDSTETDLVSSFFTSTDGVAEDITASGIKIDLQKFEKTSDRLYLVRSWLRNNTNNKNAISIMNLGLDLLLEDSSVNKPTTSALLDISAPLTKIYNDKDIKDYVSRINSLLLTINTPSIDLIKLSLLLSEAEFKINIGNANSRLLELYNFIDNLEDVVIKAEAYANCWYFLKRAYSNGFQEDQIIFRENEIKLLLEKQLDIIIYTSAQQFRELVNTVKTISRVDLSFVVSLIERVNTKQRQDWCYIASIESHTLLPVSEWNVELIRKIFSKVSVEDTLGKIMLKIVNSASKQKVNKIDGRHKFIELLYVIEKINNNELKCYIIVKSIYVLMQQPNIKPIGLSRNYNNSIKKLKNYLLECWMRIMNPWVRINSGYKIAADIAGTDLLLAQDYYAKSKNIESKSFVDNETYASVCIKAIMIAIEACVGAYKYGLNPEYDHIGHLIDNINSNLDQVSIWSEFAVKAHLVNAKSQADTIVSSKIVPIIEVYNIEKADKNYLNELILHAASALYLTQPSYFKFLLNKLSTDYRQMAISNIINVIINDVFEGDNYESKAGSSNFNFEKLSSIISLLEYVEDDTLLFMLVQRLAYTVKEQTLKITREQKTSSKQIVNDLLKSKLPNTKEGIKHEGYLIVCEILLTHFDISYQENEYSKLMDDLEERTDKITNLSDQSFIFSILASECNERAKKYRQKFLDKAFITADQLQSTRERFDRYENALIAAKQISESVFVNKIREINSEIFKIDNRDLFPTHRRLIDLAYEYDKNLAQKLISVLDTDPARKKMTFPVEKHLEQVKQEKEASDDYAKFSKLDSRNQIRKVAVKNIGQLNSGKRMAKPIDQTLPLLKIASKVPLTYSFDVYNLFIKNMIKKTGSTSKYKPIMQSIYDASVINARFTYNIVTNLSSKKSYFPSSYSIKNVEKSFMIKPGQREAALEYIYDFVSGIESEEIFVIDSYLSENDMRFLRGIVENCPHAHITVMTSLEGSRGKVSIDRPSFVNAWKDISADPLPSMTVMRINKADQTSPFHDRWIISSDLKQGIKIGTSFNSIGGGKVSSISIMPAEEIETTYNSVIDPFINQRLVVYGKDKIKHESFSL